MKVLIGQKHWQEEAESVECECLHFRKEHLSGQAPVPGEGATCGVCCPSVGWWRHTSVDGIFDRSCRWPWSEMRAGFQGLGRQCHATNRSFSSVAFVPAGAWDSQTKGVTIISYKPSRREYEPQTEQLTIQELEITEQPERDSKIRVRLRYSEITKYVRISLLLHLFETNWTFKKRIKEGGQSMD